MLLLNLRDSVRVLCRLLSIQSINNDSDKTV